MTPSAVRTALGALLWALNLSAVAASDDLEMLAPGVYWHRGVHQEASAANRGDIANKGVVVGTRCAAVIDTGGSLADGQALIDAITQMTAVPVCYVINTHMHPDHVFGNAAFEALDPRPEFIGHSNLQAALAQRASTYLNRLDALLGDAAAGTRVVGPDRVVDGQLELDLGGRTLVLQSWPTAHTNNDLTVFDRASGVVWLSDLLFRERIPALDGSLTGWLAVSAQLRELPARIGVPGHGPAGTDWRAALEAQDAYLNRVAATVRQALKEGRSLAQTVAAADPADAAGWQLADDYHVRNLTAAFAELEWE